jgi:para-nitrobenzyl esterase
MAEETSTRQQEYGRRDWFRQTATLAAGAAVAPLLTSACAREESGPQTVSVGRGPILTAPNDGNTVETSSGRVRGFVRNGIVTFKGIPYAASTAGANRYMPPVTPEPWTGVRSTMAFGAACPQPFHLSEGRRAGWSRDEEAFMFEWDDGQPGEDCLSVNVWTPGLDAARRPVMVWIHGGGYTSGSSNELRMYDGENLARRGDLVVVSLNHRLGPLGYMNLLEYGDRWADAANVGQLDIVAALQWVRDHVDRFGGDPARVTVFGQSGGGGKISALMGMPSARGLFHRAIVQSGSLLRQATADASGALAAATLRELGVSRASIDRLQSIPVDDIIRAGLRARHTLQPVAPPPGTPGAVNWGPTADGRSIPAQVWDPTAPDVTAAVPMIIGTTLHEFGNSIQAGDPSLDAMTLDDARERLAALYADKASAIVELYQRKVPNISPYEIVGRASGMSWRNNAVQQASLKAAQRSAPAFLYLFQWRTPVLDGRPKAYHCAELPFVFASVDRCAAMTGGGAEARALEAKMADAWIAFARTGSPDHGGLPPWPIYTDTDCPTMIFDNTCAVTRNGDREERELFAS